MLKRSKTLVLILMFAVFCGLLLCAGRSERYADHFYRIVPDSTILEGDWAGKGDHYESSAGCSIIITYNARVPSVIMSADKKGVKAEIIMCKHPVLLQCRGKDIIVENGRTFSLIGDKRAYSPVSDWPSNGSRTIFIYCPPGIHFYSVSFDSGDNLRL